MALAISVALDPRLPRFAGRSPWLDRSGTLYRYWLRRGPPCGSARRRRCNRDDGVGDRASAGLGRARRPVREAARRPCTRGAIVANYARCDPSTDIQLTLTASDHRIHVTLARCRVATATLDARHSRSMQITCAPRFYPPPRDPCRDALACNRCLDGHPLHRGALLNARRTGCRNEALEERLRPVEHPLANLGLELPPHSIQP